MTRNAAFKTAVRTRMAETGENFTTARRALLGDAATGSGQAIDPPLAAALRPGTLTTIVCPFGMTTAAFALPEVLRIHRDGHPVMLYAATPERPELDDLLSPVDLLIGHGLITPADIEDLDENQGLKPLVDRLADARLPDVLFLKGSIPEADLSAALGTARPLVYVQDIQRTRPLPGHALGFDGVRDQCEALARLAEQTDATIITGLLMETEYEDDWREATDPAHEAFVIDQETEITDAEHEVRPWFAPRPVTLRHLVAGQQTETLPWEIDHEPVDAWRRALSRTVARWSAASHRLE